MLIMISKQLHPALPMHHGSAACIRPAAGSRLSDGPQTVEPAEPCNGNCLHMWGPYSALTTRV